LQPQVKHKKLGKDSVSVQGMAILHVGGIMVVIFCHSLLVAEKRFYRLTGGTFFLTFVARS